MSEVQLRDYQREAVAAAEDAFARGVKRPAEVLPTGSGKTVVFSRIAADALGNGMASRVLVLAHRDELIRQAQEKIRSVAPHLRVGVVKATENGVGAPVVVGSVQTLRHENRRRMLRGVGLVIVDECHHATSPSYRAVLEHYGCFAEGGAPALGFTATMSRADGVGLGEVWEEVVYERDIRYMITRKFLVPPRGVYVRVDDLDLSKVRKTAGDFGDGALGEALTASMAPERIVDAYREHAAGRPTLLFVPTVEFAFLMCDRFERVGVRARVVHGSQGRDERRAALAEFTAGRVDVLINCMVLTEGTDLPAASCVIISRPTTHSSLYVQMVGRVLRPYPGKVDALVLDVVGASKRHALAGLVDLIGERDAMEPDLGEVDPEAVDDIIEDLRDEEDMRARRWLDGVIVSEEVDLFHGQRAVWQRTYGGHWFVDCPERLIVVIPDPTRTGAWDVVSAHKKLVGESDWITRGVTDLGYAMAHAESVIGTGEAALAKRRAQWRSRPVSQTQRDTLRRWGMVLPEQARSGEASAAISVALASARIDPRVPAAR